MKRLLPLIALAALPAFASEYAIVVSAQTATNAGWSEVVRALSEKHPGASVLNYSGSVSEVRAGLSKAMPRFTCFVAQPEEATKEFVAAVHQLTRQFDDDPYADTFWGILTGYDSSNALRIASRRDPLVIRRTLSGTPIPLDRCEEGIWYSELEAGVVGRKTKDREPVRETAEADSTAAIVAGLNDYNADLFITSGHATERDWQIGYRYRGGQFRCAAGQLYGLDTKKQRHPISSDHVRVYLPIGNCLMGHVDGRDAMALAFMNSAGVTQMAGYTVPTWYGYAGWGLLDYFLEQPGRYTLTEAFFANHHALIHRLSEPGLSAQDRKGLEYDRDTVAFYGDPAWSARMADGPRSWEQKLSQDGKTFTFEIKPAKGADSFEAGDKNGSQRGGRPFIAFLPERIGPAKVTEGADLHPVVGDDFVLVPNLGACDPARTYRVVFQALEL